MISHVKFVSIPTRDQPRALKFWTEQVGFKVLTDQPFDDKQRWIELRVGSSETRVVLFMMDEGGVQPGMRFNAAFACDNVERTYEELSGRGVNFVMGSSGLSSRTTRAGVVRPAVTARHCS